jgi:hypothetical protein
MYSSAQYASDAFFEEVLAQSNLVRDEAKRRKQTVLTIAYLAKDFPRPNATWRKRFADAASTGEVDSLAAIVTQSTIVRGLLKTMQWLAPSTPRYQQQVFANCDEAILWLEESRKERLLAMRSFYEELLSKHPEAKL